LELTRNCLFTHFIAPQKQNTASGWGFAPDPTRELMTLPQIF